MTIWGAAFVPVVTVIVLLLFFRHKTVWFEFLIPVVVSLIMIGVCKSCTEGIATQDTEYWGSYGVRATYYEDWNEKVPCRHPKYCTRAVTRTDANGNTYTTMETYQCGYEHSYDVDYHPEIWMISDNLGGSYFIPKSKYTSLVNRWGPEKFRDLRRHYHTNDGDSYYTTWNKEDHTIEPIVRTHTYENRVQASTSIFNYPEVEDPTVFGLYDYPETKGLTCRSVLGGGHDAANRHLDIWNAKLGKPKQVRMWMLMFVDQPLLAAQEQEAYWKGGNKNEVVVCLGLDKQSNLQWCHVFSWSESETMKVRIRTEIVSLEKFDSLKAAQIMTTNIQKDFKRKEFADFSYLTVEPPIKYVIMTYLLTILVNVGISAFVILNDIKEKEKETV
jgi:hypothetical protein